MEIETSITLWSVTHVHIDNVARIFPSNDGRCAVKSVDRCFPLPPAIGIISRRIIVLYFLQLSIGARATGMLERLNGTCS